MSLRQSTAVCLDCFVGFKLTTGTVVEQVDVPAPKPVESYGDDDEDDDEDE